MTRDHTTLRIGLTGGIGAGKSTVAAIWRRSGRTVIDLDAYSRAVLDVPGPGVEETAARFGDDLRTRAGTIDRARLARLVFADEAARADLEDIVLGRVDEAVLAAEREALASGQSLVIHDSPLLLEKHRETDYDAVIAVLARREDRIARVLASRNRDREYVESVMAAQVTDLERIRRADRLVLNTSDDQVLAERAEDALDAVLGSVPTRSAEAPCP